MLIRSSLFAVALCCTTSAFAADMSTRAAPVAAPITSAYNWTGLYAGIQAGGVWNRSNWSNFAGPEFDTNGSSALIGIQGGYNYQWNNVVLGVEGEFSGFIADGKSQCSNAVGTQCRTRQTWLAAARARAGYAFDRVLVYGTGGIAFTDYKFEQTVAFSQSWGGGNRVGWTAGLGLEYALTDYWSIGAEWKHYDFGKKTGSGGINPASIDFREASDVAVVKLNFKY